MHTCEYYGYFTSGSCSDMNNQCHYHLLWNRELGSVSPAPSPKVAWEFSHLGLQHTHTYQRDDGLKLMSLWGLNQLSACLNMVTWVWMYKDRKRLINSVCLWAGDTWGCEIEFYEQWVICQLSPPHTFFKPVSAFSLITKEPVILEKRKAAQHRACVLNRLVMPTSWYNHQEFFYIPARGLG